MTTLQEYLANVTQHLLKFLESNLPLIGGSNWWQTSVIEKLNAHQAKHIEKRQISTLDNFDLALSISLLERNWREITNNIKGLDYRRGLNLVIEVKNIRNHYAHEPSTGTPIDQKTRDIDSIVRLLTMLHSDQSIIDQGKALHIAWMKAMLSSTSEDDEDGNDERNGSADNAPASTSTKEITGGLPVPWLRAKTILDTNILSQVNLATYVGIDFGTSTSVASIASADTISGGLRVEAIKIKQVDELGREIHSHLVNTCLAWFNQNLLFGSGAARLKQELTANQNIWTSFKMGLGVDLGPEYNRTALPDGKHPYTIERPQQAAAEFLKLLCNSIRDQIKAKNYAEPIYYTVTVPASFEANQRRDLFAALEFAGVHKDKISLMDEPNAAFLSYLIDMESESTNNRFIDLFQQRKRNIVIFDFGAGTCDISILEVSVSQASILSRNLGISKFWSLGGDDIDRVIANRILLPQLCGDSGVAKYLFTSTQLEQQVIPYLKSLAESLKIACCELAEQRNWRTLEDLRSSTEKVTGKPGKPFKILEKQWEISEPQMSLKEFAEIMALFVGEPSNLKPDATLVNVLQPIDNALEKIDLTKEDIDIILFIGGSCENPIIRNYVSKHFGRFVESITPKDLRAHVSQGAALYSLLTNGAKIDPIRPITSESIHVMTFGEQLQTLIKAGSLVPSADALTTTLEVLRDGQRIIELPFFSGNVNKPIGHMQIDAPKKDAGFKRGDKVKISCSLTKEKILQVEVEIGRIKKFSEFQNPLTNDEATDETLTMLKAKQAFNKSVLEGKGRPSAAHTLAYARAAAKAQHWRLAAEMLEAAERLDSTMDHSTDICYYYSRDGDNKNSYKWSTIAYKRRPSALTAYNYAIDKLRQGNTDEYAELLCESINHNPNYTTSLVHYGKYLLNRGDSLGVEYLQRALDLFKSELDDDYLEDSDVSRFEQAAEALGKTDLLLTLKNYQRTQKPIDRAQPYQKQNLVGTIDAFSASMRPDEG